MAKAYQTYLQDDDTASLNRWLLGLLEPGIHRGFELGPGADTWDVLVSHDNTGLSEITVVGATTAKTGIAVTPQGSVIHEDGEITISLSPADPSNPRYDLIYLEYVYSATLIGGNPITYGKITGTAAADPVKPVVPEPRYQVPIGYVYIPGGVASVEDAIFTRFKARPNMNGKPDQLLDSVRGTLKILDQQDYVGKYIDIDTTIDAGSLDIWNRTGFHILTADFAASAFSIVTTGDCDLMLITVGDGLSGAATQLFMEMRPVDVATFEEPITYFRTRVAGTWSPLYRFSQVETINLGTFDGATGSVVSWIDGTLLAAYPSISTPTKVIRRTGKYVCEVLTPEGLILCFMDVSTYKSDVTEYTSKVTFTSTSSLSRVSFYYKGSAIGSAVTTLLALDAKYRVPLSYLNSCSAVEPGYVTRHGGFIRMTGRIRIPNGSGGGGPFDTVLPVAQFPIEGLEFEEDAATSITGGILLKRNGLGTISGGDNVIACTVRVTISGSLAKIYIKSYSEYSDTELPNDDLPRELVITGLMLPTRST